VLVEFETKIGIVWIKNKIKMAYLPSALFGEFKWVKCLVPATIFKETSLGKRPTFSYCQQFPIPKPIFVS
jgi:hypothetical protein